MAKRQHLGVCQTTQMTRTGRQARRRGAVWLAPNTLQDEALALSTTRPQTSGALALAPEPSTEVEVRRVSAPSCVLIVEDDPHVASMLRHALELDGRPNWSIDVITNGLAAVRRAQQSAPNIVLLDVRLPDMDGAEVYHRLRAAPETRECQVVFLTASNSLDLSLRGVDGGILLRKPFDVEQVIGLVSALLQEP